MTSVRRLAGLLLVVAVAGLWAAFLLPRSLGGSASYLIVSGHSMDGTYASGDLVIVRSRSTYAVGDIVGYKVPAGTPGAGHLVIHRVTGGDATSGFVTQGDNNAEPDMWRPKPSDMLGTAFVRLPAGGRWLVWLRTPVGVGVLGGVLAFWVLIAGETVRSRTPRGRDDILPAR